MKTKRYWLRVAFVFLVLYLIPAIIIYINLINSLTIKCIPNANSLGCGWGFTYIILLGLPFGVVLSPFTALGLPLPIFPDIMNNDAYLGITLIIMSSICVFITGAIIGWLYGKIKNRNKTS